MADLSELLDEMKTRGLIHEYQSSTAYTVEKINEAAAAQKPLVYVSPGAMTTKRWVRHQGAQRRIVQNVFTVEVSLHSVKGILADKGIVEEVRKVLENAPNFVEGLSIVECTDEPYQLPNNSFKCDFVFRQMMLV